MRYLISILTLVIFNNLYAQMGHEGAIKIGFFQNDEFVFLKDTISVKYINQENNELVLDTIYTNPYMPIPPKVLPAGSYKIEIRANKSLKIVVFDIIVVQGKISFIEEFNVDSLINWKKTLKLKYQHPKVGYKSCG